MPQFACENSDILNVRHYFAQFDAHYAATCAIVNTKQAHGARTQTQETRTQTTSQEKKTQK